MCLEFGDSELQTYVFLRVATKLTNQFLNNFALILGMGTNFK
jgi:hypothetical protein